MKGSSASAVSAGTCPIFFHREISLRGEGHSSQTPIASPLVGSGSSRRNSTTDPSWQCALTIRARSGIVVPPTIVNVDRIKELQPLFHGEYVVILRNGTKLTLSRNYRDALHQLMGKLP